MLIAMAVQAKKQELLPEWVPKVGDRFHKRGWESVFNVLEIDHEAEAYLISNGVGTTQWVYSHDLDNSFIPRQEDIQGWLYGELSPGYSTAGLIYLWAKDYPEIHHYSTPELWLAFYMHETHKLKWDGEVWV